MDLFKAFDCLPHDLLLQILKYYGTSKSAQFDTHIQNGKQISKGEKFY
jgi:hypothetical protein